MDASLRLWLDPEELAAVAVRLDAERRAARELDERILAEWAEESGSARDKQAA